MLGSAVLSSSTVLFIKLCQESVKVQNPKQYSSGEGHSYSKYFRVTNLRTFKMLMRLGSSFLLNETLGLNGYP
jgi:hypothetical protein